MCNTRPLRNCCDYQHLIGPVPCTCVMTCISNGSSEDCRYGLTCSTAFCIQFSDRFMSVQVASPPQGLQFQPKALLEGCNQLSNDLLAWSTPLRRIGAWHNLHRCEPLHPPCMTPVESGTMHLNDAAACKASNSVFSKTDKGSSLAESVQEVTRSRQTHQMQLLRQLQEAAVATCSQAQLKTCLLLKTLGLV